MVLHSACSKHGLHDVLIALEQIRNIENVVKIDSDN